MIAAKIYDLLNHAAGKPQAVAPGAYERPREIFFAHTLPILDEVAGHLGPGSVVLVVGCGSGVEIEWFSGRCAKVFAVDVEPAAIAAAKDATRHLGNVACGLTDGRTLPFGDEHFDLIFMHNVCEHILDVERNFSEFYRCLKPRGVLFNVFAPLFYSPYGAHLQDALKLPWGHLIFGLRAVVELRNRYYPGVLSARTWADVGLNRITAGGYNRVIARTRFRRLSQEIRVSRNIPFVRHVPWLRDLFILGIKDVLTK